jgi:hypothetical protein
MYRCVLPALLGLTLAAAVPAQTLRPFPATALRGTLMVVQPPEVQLNGHPARLSPGARIRGPDNLLHLSGSLIGQKLLVHFTLEPSGMVHDVWILTAAEAARRPWPATPDEAQQWLFNPAAQTWTRR